MADERFADRSGLVETGGADVGAKRYPHGLAMPFLCGFNARHWSFCEDQPVFEASFGKGNKYYARETEYDVPDGAFVTDRVKVTQGEVHLSSNLSEAHDKNFMTAVETSIGGAAGSASASFALEESSHVATESRKASISIGALKSIYSFARHEIGQLTPRFLTAVSLLPNRFDADDSKCRMEFTSFFEAWGTHYLQYGLFGGTYTLVMTSDEEVLRNSNARRASASLSAGFDSGIASGSAKSTIEQQTADALGVDRKSLKEDWVIIGGDDGSELQGWLKSVNRMEQLLYDVITMRAAANDHRPGTAPKFRPVSELVEADHRLKIDQALEAYLGSSSPLPVGNQTKPVWRMVNRADRSGFLFAAATPASDIEDAYLGYGVAMDDGGDPQTLYAGETMARGGWDSSLFLPISEGKHFFGIETEVQGKGRLDARFQPYPVTFGEWTDLPLNGELRAEAPGFLVGHVGMKREGNCGQIRAAVDDCNVGASAHGDPASSGRVAQASFCVPVPRQARVRTSARDTTGKCDYSLRFLPIRGGLEFDGPCQPMTVGRAYTAATDGFVIARLQLDAAENVKFRGWFVGSIHVNDAERPDASFQAPFSATWNAAYRLSDSAFEMMKWMALGLLGDCLIPIATATAFVRSGSTWTVSVGASEGLNTPVVPRGSEHARCWWQPVKSV
jgi:MAC/Perforin domain